MYENPPQHVIDEASVPGPAAAWMDSSSSEDLSSDGEDSDEPNGTAPRIKRTMRRRMHRSTMNSEETDSQAASQLAPVGTGSTSMIQDDITNKEASPSPGFGHRFGAIESGNNRSDNQNDIHDNRGASSGKPSKSKSKKKEEARKRHKKHPNNAAAGSSDRPDTVLQKDAENDAKDGNTRQFDASRRVDFAAGDDLEAQRNDPPKKRPFDILTKTFSQNVFQKDPQPNETSASPSGRVPRVRYGIHRTNSLPMHLDDNSRWSRRVSAPYIIPSTALPGIRPIEGEDEEENISRTTAVLLLLISTGLVAVCAEFMVSAIGAVTTNSGVSATFIGLIVLPIVGNAAEHVTAVTVAVKNKLDLAIGVAIGSSIQIGLSSLSASPFRSSPSLFLHTANA
jgi:Ca2+/Na+ antiporter